MRSRVRPFVLRRAGVPLLAALATQGCAPRRPSAALPPPCPAPAAAAGDWHEVRAVAGRFALRLPPGARVVHDGPCGDSICGLFDVGGWELRYDRGAMAGPGDRLRALERTAGPPARCAEVIGGRRVLLMTYRVSPDAPAYEARVRGKWVGLAAAVAGPGGDGLYLRAYGDSAAAVGQFLAAVRTLRVE